MTTDERAFKRDLDNVSREMMSDRSCLILTVWPRVDGANRACLWAETVLPSQPCPTCGKVPGAAATHRDIWFERITFSRMTLIEASATLGQALAARDQAGFRRGCDRLAAQRHTPNLAYCLGRLRFNLQRVVDEPSRVIVECEIGRQYLGDLVRRLEQGARSALSLKVPDPHAPIAQSLSAAASR